MQPSEVWGERWNANSDPLARRWMETVVSKQSMVVLAADVYTMNELNNLLDQVSPYVSALKTHVDLVHDWTPDSWDDFCNRAKDADMLIFEDRKHGDIGKIARDQMGGIYDSRSWADFLLTEAYGALKKPNQVEAEIQEILKSPEQNDLLKKVAQTKLKIMDWEKKFKEVL